MGRTRQFLAQVSIGLLALGLAGGASAQPSPTPKRGGTIVWAIASEPGMLTPSITTASPEQNVTCNIYEALVAFNSKAKRFDPELAESWTISPDGKTYTFKLRKATWHDGMPFTSEDVRYTIVEVSSKIGPTFAGGMGKLIEAVNTPDPQTIEIKLKEPFGPGLLGLACNSVAILPAHIYKGTDPRTNPAGNKPIGTGAFKFSEWVRGDHIRLVRNENYWDKGKPYLDSVVMKIMPNGASRTQALIAGEVDYIPFTFFPGTDANAVAAKPNTKLEVSGYPASQLFGFFNLKRKPMSDVKVRHALLTATDRKYIFDNAFEGQGRPGQSPWATSIEWAHDPAVNYDKSHPFDPEKAAQMLEEAGYKAGTDGIRFKLTMVYDAARPEQNLTASALKAMWRRAGVDVELVRLEAAVLLPRVNKDGNFDFYMGAYTSSHDPALGIAAAYVSSTIGNNFGNSASYSNPEIDALFAKGATQPTQEERGAVYKQIETILMRDLPVITLHENFGRDAANKKLVGGWGWSSNLRVKEAWLEP